MFELQQKLATITSVNLRKELHGEERVGAVDIGVTLTGENNLLLMLDPYLVNAFYRGAASGQGELDGRLPDLKFPDLAMPMKWGYVGLGYEIALDYGMNDDKQLRFIGCQVDKFKLDLKAGGSVEIAMRIVAKPTDEAVGELYELLGGEAKLSLAAPIAGEEQQQEEDSPQADLLADADGGEYDAAQYEKAAAFVRKNNRVSVSAIQRHLRIGYNHAARIIEQMESAGVVSAIDETGGRTVIPQTDGDGEIDVLYPRALASVRATGNPTASALQTELKIDFNHAALLLARLADEGVIAQNDAGDYVVVEAA